MNNKQLKNSKIIDSFRSLYNFFSDLSGERNFTSIGEIPRTTAISLQLPVEVSHADQLVYCISGSISYRYYFENQPMLFHLREGETLFIPKAAVYQPITDENEFELTGIYYDDEKLSTYYHSSAEPFKKVRCIPFNDNERLKEIVTGNFGQLSNHLQHYGDHTAMTCLIQLIFINVKLCIENALHYDSAPLHQIIGTAREFIYLNSQKVIKLNDVANFLQMHPAYLSSLLSSRLNQGFSELLKLQRLDNAYYLLSFSQLTIREIAEICGFNSSQYFIRKFKEHFVLSPSQVRNRLNIETRMKPSELAKTSKVAEITFTTNMSVHIDRNEEITDQTVYFLNFSDRPVEFFLMENNKPQASLGITTSGGKTRSLVQSKSYIAAFDCENQDHIATFEIKPSTKVAMVEK